MAVASIHSPNAADPALLALLPEEWEQRVRAWGQPRFRARQIFQWLHRHGVLDPDRMTNLPAALRARLKDEGVAPPLELLHAHRSADGTRKLLVGMHDGQQVETVLLDRAEGGESGGGHLTQCVSSQVGCAMGCSFCASGVAGLMRQMSAAEIMGQVWLARGQLPAERKLRGIVYMGMGEPLHNYEAVSRSLRLLTHPEGMGLSPKHITVSTSGLVPQMDKLGEEFGGQVQLAVSLHAVDDATRSRIMPINRKHALGEVLAAMRRYPLPPRRRITVEYTLMDGVNDSAADARRLVSLLRGMRVRVNLIPMNPVEGAGLKAPRDEVVDRFQDCLQRAEVPTFVRRRRGDDVAAACGQLALRGERPRVREKTRRVAQG